MNDYLEYSIDAENILDEFYEVDRILYVEGEDDKLFWGTLFEKYCSKKIEIIDVDGIKNLEPYMNKIENNQLTNAYIACDQDYTLFQGKQWHKNIIHTFGHSIENTLISKYNICDLVRGFSKINHKQNILHNIDLWFNMLINKTENLIYCDIYNEKNKLGLSIIGDNCDRFLIKKDDFNISVSSVTSHLAKFFNKNQIDDLKSELNNIHIFKFSDFIRGHFLFSAAMKFVTVFSSQLSGKKINIQKDAFFSNIFISFEKNLNSHAHASYYQAKISSLL